MQHTIESQESGTRIDVIIARITGASRSLVSDAIKRGDVRVNGETVKPSHPAELGDTVTFEIQQRPKLEVLPESIEIPILFEDDDLLVIDKPAGMVTHPAPGATSGTLVNALLAHVGKLPVAQRLSGDHDTALRAGLVHRLDRDTSGLLVVAKNDEALTKLGKAMMRRHITREYLGLIHGIPEHTRGMLDGPIGRDPHNRLKYTIVDGGKPAITHYEIREPLIKAAELTFRLETGRTHQIRVHMAALGYPIVNDPVYGKTEPRFMLPGQALHAWRLSFWHPRNNAKMSFETEPPAEYIAAKELLRTPQ